jgi:hypothetical protein
MPLEFALPDQPPQSPQGRVDPPLSKSGILKGFRWAVGGLLIAILGNYLTRWLDSHIILPPTLIGYNTSSTLSQINFIWLPPLSIMITALILGFIAYLVVRRAQEDADKRIRAIQSDLDNAKREATRWEQRAHEAEKDAALKIQEANHKVDKTEADFYESLQGQKESRDRAVSEAELKAKYDCEKTVAQWKQSAEALQKNLDDLTKCQNDELEKLIKPLFLLYKKFYDEREFPPFNKISLTSFLMSPKSTELPDIKEAHDIIDLFNRHGNLAQPELKGLIGQFCTFNRNQSEKNIPIDDPYFLKIYTTVDEIEELAKARYAELMWEKKD